MRENIQNRLKITCEGVDLETVTNIEFYVSQSRFFGRYTPVVMSSTEMVVLIPFEDAKKLQEGKVELQFAFTDAEGNPRATDVVTDNVNRLLREVGYDPIQSK